MYGLDHAWKASTKEEAIEGDVRPRTKASAGARRRRSRPPAPGVGGAAPGSLPGFNLCGICRGVQQIIGRRVVRPVAPQEEARRLEVDPGDDLLRPLAIVGADRRHIGCTADSGRPPNAGSRWRLIWSHLSVRPHSQDDAPFIARYRPFVALALQLVASTRASIASLMP